MTVTNTVKVSSITIPFMGKVSSSLPVCLNSNHEYDKVFTGGSGSTMNISIPDFGVTRESTPAISDADLSYIGASIPLVVTLKTKGIALTQQNMSVDFSDLKDQVRVSYAREFASSVQKPVIKSLVYGACSATLVTDTKEFDALADAVASVQQSRSAGDIVGCWSPRFNASVVKSGIKFYNPQPQISELFKNGAVGRFDTAECFVTPDFSNYTWTDGLTLGGSTVLKGAITFATDAILGTKSSTSVVLTVLGGTPTMTGTVLAGTPFTIAGLNKTDIYGNDAGFPFVFIAQSTTGAAAANTVTVTTQAIFATGPNKNITNSTDVSATTVSNLLTSGKLYAIGSIWDKSALAFGEAKLAPILGAQSDSFEDPQGLSVTASLGHSIQSGFGVLRYDCLTGSALPRPMWAHTMYMALN